MARNRENTLKLLNRSVVRYQKNVKTLDFSFHQINLKIHIKLSFLILLMFDEEKRKSNQSTKLNHINVITEEIIYKQDKNVLYVPIFK